MRGCVCPSVGTYVGPSVCSVLFSNDDFFTVLEDKKSSNDIVTNDTMSDDEVAASDVPPRYSFLLSVRLSRLVCLSTCTSVCVFFPYLAAIKDGR